MKCPNCGAENPDGKRFCGDCGGTMSGPIGTPRRLSREQKAIVVVFAVVAVAVMVVLAAILAFGYGRTDEPEEVFSEWVDCMNDRKPTRAAGLTIFSVLGMSIYSSQIAVLEDILAAMGDYVISLNYAFELSKGETRNRYPLIDEVLSALRYDYEIEVEDWCGLDISYSINQNGEWDIWADSWPCFRIDSSWYLGYRAESIL